MSERDPFLALCDLASRENWCWKMWCSTCGHMYFRFSFQELVDGKHPDSASWLVRQENHQALRVIGPLPSLGGWPMEKQRALAKILTQADVAAIHRACRFSCRTRAITGLGRHAGLGGHAVLMAVALRHWSTCAREPNAAGAPYRKFDHRPPRGGGTWRLRGESQPDPQPAGNKLQPIRLASRRGPLRRATNRRA